MSNQNHNTRPNAFRKFGWVLVPIIAFMGFSFFKKKDETAGKQNAAYEEMHASEFEKLVEKEGADKLEILDVRTPGEYQEGHIPTSKNINIMDGDFMERVEALPKDKKYYLVCRSGNRSGRAAQMMKNAGFEELVNVAGGMMAYDGEVEQ